MSCIVSLILPYIGVMYESATLRIRWHIASRDVLEAFNDCLDSIPVFSARVRELNTSLTVLPLPLCPTMTVSG